MITYQIFSQQKQNGEMKNRYHIDCKKNELEELPTFLLQNGSKATTTNEGKNYVFDEENEGWCEKQ